MTGPHQDQPLETAGAPLDKARAAVVMVHGRGASARSILQMAAQFSHEQVAYLAPQAARSTWYPNSFLAPVEANEPGRSSGLQAIGDAVGRAAEAGIPVERIMLLGFSQGACLSSEFVARKPRKYGGLAVLSGGLIGDEIDESDYTGDLQKTPVFLGCSDVDPHIPKPRVDVSARVFEKLGADVTKRIYPGMGHGVNEDELNFVSEMLDALVR
jgi:phospholipase/carboxylesterase